MKAEYKPKSWYKQLINIAKGQLQIEESTYRAILKDKTGKVSLKLMSIPELFIVLEHMKYLGFKPISNKNKSPKSSEKKSDEKNMLDKLRQIWIQMYYQGFLNDGSEPALQNWASKQSKSLNKGVAITKLEWLDGQMQYRLIEKLKQWHMRELSKVFQGVLTTVKELHVKGELNEDERKDLVFIKKRLSTAAATHQVLSSAYGTFLSILKQHNVKVGR
jgi:phage gp16-like protein